MNTDDEQIIVLYVLGELQGAEKEHFEERYFLDNGLFERVEAVKRDLIDDYLRDRLPRPQSERFRQYFGSNPYRWQQVETRRTTLENTSDQLRSSLSTRYVIAWSAALAIMAAIALTLFFENRGLRLQLETPPAPVIPLATAPTTAPEAAVERLYLDATALIRDAATQEASSVPILRLNRNAAVIEITLAYRDAVRSERYTAVLVDADGLERASHNELIADIRNGTGQITAIFASSLLTQGSYVLRLKNSRGMTVESYAFGTRTE